MRKNFPLADIKVDPLSGNVDEGTFYNIVKPWGSVRKQQKKMFFYWIVAKFRMERGGGSEVSGPFFKQVTFERLPLTLQKCNDVEVKRVQNNRNFDNPTSFLSQYQDLYR